MKKLRIILGIVLIALFLLMLYIWGGGRLSPRGLAYLYYISPYYDNSTIDNFSEEELSNSLPADYAIVDNNISLRNRILDRFILQNLTRPIPHPPPPENFNVLCHIYSNESYVIRGISLSYDFHFLLLEYPNGSFKIFSTAESHPTEWYGGIEEVDDSNYEKHKATLIKKAHDDFHAICDLIIDIHIDVTHLFVPSYW